MPTINKRFLLRLVLTLLASAGALVAAHAVQARRIPAALKQQAELAADAGKPDVAVHYLRQYLEFHPDDVDSQVRLAELLATRPITGRGQAELLFLYDKILRLDPDRHATRREALATALRLGKYADAVTHGEALLKQFPTEPVLWHQLAGAQAGLNQNATARQSYEQAVRHAPEQLIGYQQLAQLLWKNLDDTAGARAVLDRMVKALPQEPDVYLIRARFDTFTAEDSAAAPFRQPITDLQRVLELDPENAEASLLLAEIMQKSRNVPAAHTLMRDAVALYPKNLKLVRGLSWLELIRGNTAAAVSVLEDGLKATPDGFDLMVPLADLLVYQGDTARTADLLHRLEARKAPPTQLKYLKARVAMREQQWPQAVAVIESLRAEPEVAKLPGLHVQLNLLLAACYGKLGDPAAEEKAYQRVTNADPKNVTARVGLGNLYLNLGRFDAAARELDAALQSPYATGAVVTQWVKLKAQLLAGGPPAEWQRLEAATVALAPRFARGSSEPIILRADVLAAQGRLADAVKLLRQEAARRAGDAHLWAALASQTADLSGCAAGLAVLDEAQASAGDCADVRLARAALYAREPGRVRPIGPLADHTETWSENEQLRLLSGLVEVYDRTGDTASVVGTLRKIVARQPANAGMWLKLHERAGDDAATAAAARAALAKLEGENGASVLLCDARAANGENAAALAARLTAAFGANPTRADACLELAHLKQLAGNPTGAAALLTRAFLLEPTRYESAEALLAHQARNGTADRTAPLLARLATDPRWAGEPFRRMVGHVLANLPSHAAGSVLALCRPLAERDPGGAAWMAECAVALNQPDSAALLEAATQRPGANADDWLRKALFTSKENPAAGPGVLAEARAKLAPAAYFALVAVYCDTAAGSTFVPEAATPDDRRALAQARLAVKLCRSQSAEASKILEEFLTHTDLRTPDADWARRNLAMLYAVGGTPEDRAKAMALLKGVTATATATPEELRATASVLTTLGRYLEGADRRAVLGHAIASLSAAHKATNAPSYLFAVSQLHRATGDRVASRKCLQQLLSDPKDPSYPFYLRAALDELVEDGNFAAARTFAGKLTAVHAGDFNSLASVARFECKAGHPERGLAVAEDYARVADAGAGDYLVRAARVAELLDELSRLPGVRGTPVARRMADAAVERYAAVVPNRPEAIVGAAGVLAADGRAADAFARVEKLGRYIPARLRASAGLAVVRGGAVTDRQAETVRQWLDDCLAEEPASVPLLLNRAEFLALRHDLPAAVQGFEAVLAKEPKDVIALNNLAWLLAADPATAERALALVTRATRESGLTGELLDTRARVEITLRQFDAAERDLAEAIGHAPTALRWFHVALLRTSQSPPNASEAAKAFAEAKRRGIDARSIHPADLPALKALDVAK